MATQDTTTEDTTQEELDEEVETSQEEDETTTDTDDASDEETEDQDEDEESEEDADAETEEDDKPEFKKRFTQFKGETYEAYVPELEKAHAHLIGELTRVKQGDKDKQGKIDAVMAAAAKDPEFAKKLDELMGEEAEQVTVDPALLKARQDMEEQMTKDYNAFVDLHPELETDPILSKEVFEYIEELGALSRKKGKIMSMKSALTKAWALARPDDDDQEKVVVKAKEVAAKAKTGSSAKKPVKKSGFTEEQIRVAKKWGLTPEQLAATKSS